MYSKSMIAGWGDMDSNAHMRNSAFLDKASDVRMLFFAEHGFPVSEFTRLRLGPVVTKDELEYRREVTLLQPLTVTLEIAGMAPDGSRFVIRNDLLRVDGKLCARVTSVVGWLDLVARKLVAPPEALLAAVRSADKTSDFVELPSALAGRL